MNNIKGIKQKDLENIKNLSYEDKTKIIKKLPIRMSTKLYALYGSADEIEDLFIDWDDLVNNPIRAYDYDNQNPESVSKIHTKKIKLLISQLKKLRKIYYIPKEILKKYK